MSARLPTLWALSLSVSCLAAEFDVLSLPALFVDGQPARAHTQGLELVGTNYYVTARQESPEPKRALLLRTAPGQGRWLPWDVTPKKPEGVAGNLDHPGGMQFDGKLLWIPVAESIPHGHSVVRAYDITRLAEGLAAIPSLEFPVTDHIGALAVAAERGLIFGANWDTETVYVWNLEGQLRQTLSKAELRLRHLGYGPKEERFEGVAIQDWKMVGERLYASGLFPGSEGAAGSGRSRLLEFENFLSRDVVSRMVRLPRQGGIEMAREAMAVAGGFVYFLPGDLGQTNRVYRAGLGKVFE